MATLTKPAYVCSGGEVTPSPFGRRPRGCESLKAPQTGAGGPASAGGARTLPIRLRLTTTTRLSFLPSITAPSRSNHNQASSLPPLKLCSIQPWHTRRPEVSPSPTSIAARPFVQPRRSPCLVSRPTRPVLEQCSGSVSATDSQLRHQQRTCANAACKRRLPLL